MEEILRNETLHIVIGTSEPYSYQDMAFAVTVLRFDSLSYRGRTWTHRAILIEPLGTPSDAAAIVVLGPGEANDEFLETFGIRAAAEAGVPVLLLYDLPPEVSAGEGLSAVLDSIRSVNSTAPDEDFLIHAMAAAIMRAATLVSAVSPSHPERFVVSGVGVSGWAAAVAGAADPRIVGVELRSPAAWDLRGGAGSSPDLLEALLSISEEAQRRIVERYDPLSLLQGEGVPVLVSVEAGAACGAEGMLRSEALLAVTIVPGEEGGLENATMAQSGAAWRAFLKHVVRGAPLPEVGVPSVEADGPSYRVTVRVSGEGAIVRNVNLWYRSADGGWRSLGMETSDGRNFTCEVPASEGCVPMYATVWFTSGGSDGFLSSPPVCAAP